jgi:hypothetical protein
MRTRLLWLALLWGSILLLQTCVPVALWNTTAAAYEPVAPEHAVAATHTGNDPGLYHWHIEPVDRRAEPNIHTVSATAMVNGLRVFLPSVMLPGKLPLSVWPQYRSK